MVTQLEVGDRVQARARSYIPAGTLGCVRTKLASVVDMYFVQFDGENHPTLMRATDLERVTDAVADEDAR